MALCGLLTWHLLQMSTQIIRHPQTNYSHPGLSSNCPSSPSYCSTCTSNPTVPLSSLSPKPLIHCGLETLPSLLIKPSTFLTSENLPCKYLASLRSAAFLFFFNRDITCIDKLGPQWTASRTETRQSRDNGEYNCSRQVNTLHFHPLPHHDPPQPPPNPSQGQPCPPGGGGGGSENSPSSMAD